MPGTRLLNAPLAFFDGTTTGAVLNRFLSDTQLIDSSVPDSLLSLATELLTMLTQVALVLFFGVRTWRRQRRRGKRFTTSQLGKRKANLPGEVHLRDFDGASGLSRQSTELELPHSNGGGGAGARAHQPLHDEVSLPGTDDGEPTASVERI